MAKNIVICCDGTGNQVSGFPTNVLRLYHMLVRNGNQMAYYDGGVGTLVDPTSLSRFQKWVRRKLDGATGNSIRSNFCRAYQFLASVYEPGDRIFLFGFSRGAYTVRALAGAIYRFGILRPELADLVDYAWSSYADEMQELSDHTRFEAAARFKKYFAVEATTPIWFVGVFDTVSSLGWIWDYRTLPNTAQNPAIMHVRHALAIDERRTLFGANRFVSEEISLPQTYKEVWFPGVHSDIGGGYPDEEAGLAKITLKWMIREAMDHGLCVDSDLRNSLLGGDGKYSTPNPTAKLHQSLEGLWHLLEVLPRRVWNGKRKRMTWRFPNLWRRRPYGEKPHAHISVMQRAAAVPGYKPRINLDMSEVES